jgi:hypothetical protein
MEQIRISAKTLGAMALDDFCPRCFYIKLHTKALPWQIFPGIFSSIDAYTKRVVHALIDRAIEAGKGDGLPLWMKSMGDIQGYLKVPHWSKFKAEIKEFNILLTGGPDDLWVDTTGGIIIPDYKTAKYTETQDKLRPMYEVQLNGYAMIAGECEIKPVIRLFMVYMEPFTEDSAADNPKNLDLDGFAMWFSAHPVEVPLAPESLKPLFDRLRKLYDLVEPPDGNPKCKDCEAVHGIMELLA